MHAADERIRIAIAVGDTVGHASTALAIAEAFRDRHADVDVLFLGTSDSLAASVLAREGAAFVAVPGGPLRRAGPQTIATSVVRTVDGVRVARAALNARGSRLAFGVGGFATGSVLIAARTIGAATAIHEANVEPGLANVLLAPIVDRVYLAHAGTRLRGLETGTPVRKVIAAVGVRHRQPPGGTLRVLITTGSRGDAWLAERVPPLLHELRRKGVGVEVMQQIGDGDAPTLVEQYATMDIPARTAAMLDMSEAYAWADVAIARAGANTIAELSITGVPAALVPLADASANHQEANARSWAAAGAGVVAPEDEAFGAAITAWLAAMATRPEMWQAASAAAQRIARPDAARRIADDCDDLMRRSRL